MKIKYLFAGLVIVFPALVIVIKKSEPVVENTQINTPIERVAENPEGEADPTRMTLFIPEWKWISAQYNDGKELQPKTVGDFVLTFKKDGTFSAKTDCNGIGGNYTVKDNKITFGEMMGTLMYCEGSQEAEFRKLLEGASSFFFTNRGQLIIELKYDSGTATFR